MIFSPAKSRRFVLFYPSQELGGAELLLSRLADILSGRGHQVTVLDSEKGIIAKNILDPAVKCLTARIDQPVFIECDHFITFASHLSSLRRYVNPNENCNVVIWSVHPLNAIFLMPRCGEKVFQISIDFLKFLNRCFFRSEVNVREKALNSLVGSDAFVCMDAENARVLSHYYGIKNDFRFIPVPVSLPNKERHKSKLKNSAFITLAWYGRLCDFKVHTLVYLITQLGKVKDQFNLRLIIVGDGPLRGLVERAVVAAGIAADFKGTMQNDAAAVLLNQEADVVFAMGTAALEAGAMGIPTVLVDASYKPINFPYRFSWLHQTKQFTLGRFVNKSSPIRGVTVEGILKDAIVNYYEHAKASCKYVQCNHEINHVVDLVEVSCNQSKMSLARFHDLTDYKKPLSIRVAKYFRNLMLNLK